jgi:signal transduction histidine kinase
MIVYLGAALVAVVLVMTTLITDLDHEQEQARSALSLATRVRAQYVGHHLQLLSEELVRLGLRSEVDLLDANLGPERDLLRLAHEKSTFFNVGTAILDSNGVVVWSEPRSFLALETRLGRERWFESLSTTRKMQIVPAAAGANDTSILYLVTPIVRSGSFTGALLGAVDLLSSETIERVEAQPRGSWLAIATARGALLFPPAPPAAVREFVEVDLPRQPLAQPFVVENVDASERVVVAGAPIRDTGLVLLSVADAGTLLGPSRARFATRLLFGVLISVLPIVLLMLVLRRSLRTLKRSEEIVVRGDRLRSLGEAVDLIAHEVKNSLNGLRIGLDMILQGEGGAVAARYAGAVRGLRAEMERLSSFTGELLSFSKGVVPRPVRLDLRDTARRVVELSRDVADRQGTTLEVVTGGDPVWVNADPGLLRTVITNLVGNALDALGGGDVLTPRLVVTVGLAERQAWVRVADNGPGVAPKVRPRLFEPFVSGKPSGTGIGLALSRQIGRAHGGDLVLEQTPAGASFLLLLPAEDA